MNDHELDQLLAKGKTESKRFFTGMQSWHRRIVDEAVAPKRRRRLRMKTALAAAGILAATAAAVLVFTCPPAAVKQEQKLSHQTVALDDTSCEYEVNFVPVNMPKKEDTGFMMMLWQIEGDGASQMIYSGLFSECDELYPVATMNLPGTSRSMLLVASGDSERDYLHYRLLSLEDDLATIWRSQDYVPSGTVEVQDGVIVEQRRPHTDIESAQPETVVTYIVPYGVSPTGSIVLPVDTLHLRVGEQILLTGSDSGELPAVKSVGGLLSALEADEPLPVFQAAGAGSDTISVTNASGETAQLNVQIEE